MNKLSDWGYHTIIDAAGCELELINNPDNIAAFAKELVEKIDMVAYGEPHFPHGTAPAEYRPLYPPAKIKLPPNVPQAMQARARQEARQRHRLGAQRVLPFVELRERRFRLAVPTNFSVPQVLPGHQHAPRRRADGRPRVMLREPHSLGSQTVDMGSRNLFLAVATRFGPTQIVRKDEDDIEPPSRGSRRNGGRP